MDFYPCKTSVTSSCSTNYTTKSSCSQKKKRTIPPRRLSEAPLLLALTRTPCGNCSLSTGASLHSVQVRNGRSTNFCEDVSGLMIGHWRVGSFNPILHCHARRVDISISTPLTTGVASLLAPRLTLVTLTELLAPTNILTDFSLKNGEDIRACPPLASPDGVLRAGPVYKAIKMHGDLSEFSKFVWDSRARNS